MTAVYPDQQEFSYPRRALLSAYGRAGAGIVLCGIPLLLGQPGLVAGVIIGGFGLLFAGYGGRTWLRGVSRIVVDDEGIQSLGPLSAAIRWRDVTAVKLKYYSTQRDRTSGWMQLNISGRGGPIRIESTLAGFPEMVRRVVDEAQARGIELSPDTCSNLQPLGIRSEPMRQPGVAHD